MTHTDNTDERLRIPIGLLTELSIARSLDDTLDCFAKWSHVILTADRCSVSLPDGDALVVHGLSGNAAVPTGARMPLDTTFIGRVFTTRQSAILTNLTSSHYPDAQKLAAAGIKTLMIAPLLAQDRCFGTLAFGFADDVADDLDRFAIIEALGRCYGMQLLFIDQLDQLEALSRTDPLTRAFNRRHFDDVGVDLWQGWQRAGTSFAVAAVDIDHFKDVNDTYGHHAGDAVLQGVAERLRSALRKGDQVVRMGGEEFLLVLRDCTADLAERISRRARSAVGGAPLDVDGAAIDVSVSIGVATVRGEDTEIADITRRADAALYCAKSGGRDRVVRSSRMT